MEKESSRFLRVLGDNIVGTIQRSPKFVGHTIKLMVPETARKSTNVVKVVKAGPESGVTDGDVVLIQNDSGYMLDDEHILLKPADLVGRIV